MFACVFAAEGSRSDVLVSVGRDFSPRVDVCGAREVTLDLAGLNRLFGDAKTIAGELRRTAADRGLRVRIGIAATRTAARLVTRTRAGITIVDAGHEAEALADLPIELLRIFREPRESEPNEPPEPLEPTEPIPTLRRWGLRTLGELAALPSDEVAARLGQAGVDWQRLARGDDPAPLTPSLPEERFEQSLDLEWPIEGLEPLSFVLARLLEPLSAHLQRRDRGAAVLHVRLHLVTKEVHERSLQLPAPMRDARTLRTLALLDLESHPPSAAIDRVVVAVDPTPGRVIQFSLLTRPLPSPEHLSTLIARLSALMGEERVGSPVTVDSWHPGTFEMKPFAPASGSRDAGSDQRITDPRRIPDPGSRIPHVAVRRFRFPLPARVQVDRGIPIRITLDRRGLPGGRVENYAGPWRSSGGWWIDDAKTSWDRDEWDVALSDGATYRVYRERDTDAWFIEGVVD
jgi:protein ImuB